jgi:uncharacterized protein YdeI (YjbR/CyaY-like superfamily)
MPSAPRRTALDSLEQVYVADRAAWRRWLATHHARSPGIWLVFDKKSSRPDRLAYGDAVEEALCFGWIDSTVRTLDDARYVQLMAPRKPKSTWSRTNKDRVERLIAQGLMAAPGHASIERAKGNGSWASLDAVEALVVPEDLARALGAHRGAAANFAAFSPSARKGYLHWISRAVRPETRAHRVAHVAQLVASNQKSRHFVTAPAPAGGTKRATTNGAKPDAATKRTPATKRSKPTKSAPSGGRTDTAGQGSRRTRVRKTAKRRAK